MHPLVFTCSYNWIFLKRRIMIKEYLDSQKVLKLFFHFLKLSLIKEFSTVIILLNWYCIRHFKNEFSWELPSWWQSILTLTIFNYVLFYIIQHCAIPNVAMGIVQDPINVPAMVDMLALIAIHVCNLRLGCTVNVSKIFAMQINRNYRKYKKKLLFS